MTAPHDLDRHLEAFLSDGPTALPDPSFDAVRDRIEATRQRTVIGPWRMPDMNKFVPIGLGAVAVVVALAVGTQLLPVGGGPGAAPPRTPSPTPLASVAPSAPPSVPLEGLLPEGPHVLWTTPVMTLTIPAPGWFGAPGGGILTKDDSVDAPDGAGLIVFGHEDLFVYGDPCQWSTTAPEDPATTPDALVAALTAQASRDASTPVDIAVDGYAGKSITVHVPENADFAECDMGFFGTWRAGQESTPSRYQQDPGQIDEVWALDVDGALVVVDWTYYEGTPQSVIDELRSIVESITFE